MANEEHLTKLSEGVLAWNEWRQENRDITPDLSGANLSDTSLSGANLSRADLTRADLSGGDLTWTDLGDAKLNWINLHQADLSEASLSGAVLKDANLNSVNLMQASLLFADLTGASLHHALLGGAKLILANLNGADLSQANLSQTDLSMAQALATNFTGATLTGACIEDWHINHATSLQDAICDYVYLRSDGQDRCPKDGSFAPGGFTKRFQQTVSTIELQFLEGIEWPAFLRSLQTIQTRWEDAAIALQALEAKDTSTLAIRLQGAASISEIEQFAIKQEFQRAYEQELQTIDAQYQSQSTLSAEQIARHRQQSTDLLAIVKREATASTAAMQSTQAAPPPTLDPDPNWLDVELSESEPPVSAPPISEPSESQPPESERLDVPLLEIDLLGAALPGAESAVPPTSTPLSSAEAARLTTPPPEEQANVFEAAQQSPAPPEKTSVDWEDAIALLKNIHQSIQTAALPDKIKAAAIDYLQAAEREAQKANPNQERVRVNLEGTLETLAEDDSGMGADLNLWEQVTPLLVKIAGW